MYFCVSRALCVCYLNATCVGPQRGLSCVEGDLAVELNIESVVLLLVCVMMTIIIIMTTIIIEFSCTGVYLNLFIQL